MLPTNVYSFMKKMVSNTETLSAAASTYNVPPSNTSSSPSPPAPGAMGRLRQTLQQAQETVSNRLSTGNKPAGSGGGMQQPSMAQQQYQQYQHSQQQQNIEPPKFTTTDVDSPTSAEFKEIEQPRPGSVGRCRVCVKAMKPDEFFRECTECGLRVCDDCASYSSHADGNEVNWRCSVCRRKGVAIIARRVQVGIEQSEALEGVGFETKVRRSPDTRRLQQGDRADSETEVLLLAPKPSDVRRHSDVPLRDIAKFQQQTGTQLSSTSSQHDLGLSLNVNAPGEKVRAKSNTEIASTRKDNNNVQQPTAEKLRGKERGDKDAAAKAKGKLPAVKRQRSYERGASEGTLNLPGAGGNRARRASCDLRAIDPNQLANLNNINASAGQEQPQQQQKEQHQQQHGGHKARDRDRDRQQESHHHHKSGSSQQQHESSSVTSVSTTGSSGYSSGSGTGGPGSGGGGKGKEENPNLIISRPDTRRRSVQIYNTAPKPSSTPRSCASLDHGSTSDDPLKHGGKPEGVMKRQGSSTDGEAIKIVIDDVDSSNTIKDNKSTTEQLNEQRTRIVRLRRDPQDRGYQTRGFGLRVVGGCSCARGNSPGNLRARVARITPGSGADFAGIRRGDVVLFWNGIKLTNLTFEEVCKVLDASPDSVELQLACFDNEQMINTTVPEDDDGTNAVEWEETNNENVDYGYNAPNANADRGDLSPTRRKLPRLPSEGRIQLRLYHDEIHNTLEIAVVNIAFGPDDSSTLDLNDIIITLRIGDKMANTRWNQCTLFTKVSPEDLFDSWLVMELVRGGVDFIGECHVDMGRVSLDDRPVWFPFSSKGTSGHRGSIAQIAQGSATPSARELARRLRMRGLGAGGGSQSQSEEQDESSGQSSPCASSLLRPEVAWEVLGTLGPPGVMLTCRSAPTSRRGSAQSDRAAMDTIGGEEGRGSLPSTPQMPRSLPPSRRGSFAVAVEEVINRSRRSSVAYQQQRVPDYLGRLLPEIPDGGDPSMMRRRQSSWNPREAGFDLQNRRQQFERTDSLRQIQLQQPNRRTSADFRDFGADVRNRQQRKSVCVGGGAGGINDGGDENWRQHMQQQQQQQPQQQWAPRE